MDCIDIAWAAGLFEGEGTAGVYSRGRAQNRYPQLQVSMTDEDTVRAFHEIVGVGHVHGPYWNKPTDKPFWRWSCQKRDHVLILAATFLPYMGKRRAAKLRELLATNEHHGRELLAA